MIELMLDYMWTFVGHTPYKFGANVIQEGGLDCSAYVLEGLRSIGKWGKSDATAQQIFTSMTSKTTIHDAPIRGDLLFFGESRMAITHVAVCWNEHQMIEAGGTNQDGMVRVRPLSWRKDLVAILRL